MTLHFLKKLLDKLEIYTDIVIMKILDIDEGQSLLRMKLKLSLYWKDIRLKYLDLRNITDMNTVFTSDLERIWTPALLFPNTKYSQRVVFKNDSAIVAIQIIEGKFSMQNL